ncbi:S23 ribosomal protein [Aequorivita sublithincola DSM 14238]|uniref:S23 ribosomal protein n=1 Tax=Aequorivita sublithincola (strain DSM 14238 / LMG 21431 / ACAM 643 / 9-3) TaxID=746697 RepID=I3YZF8_AEQSU|nr:four helix bundle protein [Aequorivita sublithincola]AFL82376.1 S23 ribosomal protein [Aequorivita sublithincola DSM 14238]
MKSHNDLRVYQESMDLVIEIYKVTHNFPDSEKFGLTSQIRRASVSIPSNIAEGAARESKKEFKRFLYISLGSAAELETQIEISNRLGFIDDSKILKEKIYYIKRMLIKLIQTLKN